MINIRFFPLPFLLFLIIGTPAQLQNSNSIAIIQIFAITYDFTSDSFLIPFAR